MPTFDLVLPRPHPAQAIVRKEARRFNVVCMGRRWGKTVLGLIVIVFATLQGKPAAWFSPTYKMLADVWRDAKRLLQPITRRVNEQEKRIELLTGGWVDFWSLDNPDAARGRKYALAVIDEAAMVPHLAAAWQDVIRPTLTDYAGGAWFLSTPRGRNFFWQLWQRGQDEAYSEWASWQMPTASNPYINAAEIEAARQELPERTFRQEYLAEFIADSGGVFRDVAAAVSPAPAASVGTFVGGIDWGRTRDFTVLTLINADTRQTAAIDRFSGTEYAAQLARFRVMHEQYRPAVWIAERNSMGDPLVEQLQREGYPVQAFMTTNATKTHIIDALALAFERGDITIPDDPTLIAELQAFEMERLPSGMARYSAPEGMHDDMVISLALAWHGLEQIPTRRSRRAA